MHRLLFISVFLFFSIPSYAQSISPGEAKTLAEKLNGREDTSQIDLLLRLAQYQIFKPGEFKADLDSAADFIKKAENINAHIGSKWANGYILLVNSDLLRETGQSEKAEEYARQAAEILKSNPDKSLAGQAYFEFSSYFDYSETGTLEQRIKLVDTAITLFKESGDQEKLGESLDMLGDLLQIDGFDSTALQKLKLALEAYASAHHAAVQGIYSLMARSYDHERDYKNAYTYNLLALKTAQKVGDTSMQLCMINNDIGLTLSQLREFDKAIPYHSKALEIAEKYKNYESIFISATHIADAWNDLHQPQKALNTLSTLLKKYQRPKSLTVDYLMAFTYINGYSALKEYDKAVPYCKQLLNMVATLHMNDRTNLYIYGEVTKFYINSGRYTLARKYLSKHKTLAIKVADLLYIGNSYLLSFMLDTAQHNYHSAVGNLLKYKSLNDSLFNVTKSKQIADLQVEYETEQKQKDILVKDQQIQLLTKQDEFQKSSLQRGAIIRNVSFAAVALLVIIVALLYSRYRLKQRTNRKLELQQDKIERQNITLHRLVTEKDWLVREIHHRVKNNLQIVMSLLNSQSAYINNEFALNAIQESQHRVHAMSLIHQKLYNTNNLSSIDISTYIRELVSYLTESFETAQRIRFEFDLTPIEMDVSEAVPLGLILNEAITNSIKYAFPSKGDGVISISLSNIDSHHCLLIISDNGVGIPAQSINKKTGSLGMSLMQGLSEDLEGHFSIENKNGTTIKISFVHDGNVGRPPVITESFA